MQTLALPRHKAETEKTDRTVIHMELRDYLRPGGIYPYEDLPKHAQSLADRYHKEKGGTVRIYVSDVPHLSFVLSGGIDPDGSQLWSTDGFRETSFPTAREAWNNRF